MSIALRTTLFLVLVCNLTGCDQYHDAQYLDSNINSNSGYRTSLSWLDDSHVVFIGYGRGIDYSDHERKKIVRNIVIWDIKSNHKEVLKLEPLNLCQWEGNIYYFKRTQQNHSALYLVKWKDIQRGIVNPVPVKTKYDPIEYDCLQTDKPRVTTDSVRYRLDHSNNVLILWKPSYIDNNIKGRVELEINGKKQQLHIRPDLLNSVEYVSFKNAYFIRSKSNYSSNYDKRLQGDKCLDGWWLSMNGKLSLACIPTLSKLSKHGVETYPYKNGYFLVNRLFNYSKAPDIGGGYISNDKGVKKIISGLIENVSMSPDGCNMAFLHTFNHIGTRQSKPELPAVKILNLCTIE